MSLIQHPHLAFTQLSTFGQFAAGMIDGIFVEIMPDTGWRLMLGLAAVPSIIMYIGFQHLPESPRWLAMHGYTEQASEVLKSLRETEQDAADELAEIMESIEQSEANQIQEHVVDDDLYGDDDPTSSEYGSTPRPRTHSQSKQSFQKRFSNMIADAAARKALFLGCGLMVIQQFSGINT